MKTAAVVGLVLMIVVGGIYFTIRIGKSNQIYEEPDWLVQKTSLIDSSKCNENACHRCPKDMCEKISFRCELKSKMYACGPTCDAFGFYCESRKVFGGDEWGVIRENVKQLDSIKVWAFSDYNREFAYKYNNSLYVYRNGKSKRVQHAKVFNVNAVDKITFFRNSDGGVFKAWINGVHELTF
jgi:hypothetical protein